MQTPIRVIALATGLALSAATVGTAQRPQTRQGFWIAFGFGYGSANLSCDAAACSGGSDGGGTGHIRLGGTLNDQLLLGGDVTAWTKEENGITASIGNVSFIAQYYPMVQSGLFVKGGAGFSTIFFEGGGNNTSGESFGLSAGGGYDIPVGRNISITPIADFLFGGSRDLQADGATQTAGVSATMISIGLGVTFH
jgi:hypothetical protein